MVTFEEAKGILSPFGTGDRIERFLGQVRFLPNGCWEWLGRKDKDGYGIATRVYGTRRAHRIAFFMATGQLPKLLDHMVCDFEACVNPHHCTPSNDRRNVLRGRGPTAINARKTHCDRGHPFTERDWRFVQGGWARRCRECRKLERKRGAGRKSCINSNSSGQFC